LFLLERLVKEMLFLGLFSSLTYERRKKKIIKTTVTGKIFTLLGLDSSLKKEKKSDPVFGTVFYWDSHSGVFNRLTGNENPQVFYSQRLANIKNLLQE
jgi:hypothetical protein